MILNHEEIKRRALIADFEENKFADASYNLTIGQLIDMDSKINDSFTLKPQGMVYVVFKEKMVLPQDIIGFAHVKTSLTQKGIMATNIGIIDSGYVGYMSTLLINFGKSDCFLSSGDSALRVTFAKINEPKVKKPLNKNKQSLSEYTKITQQNIVNLDEKFLNLNSVEKAVSENVTSNVFTRIRNFVGVFTVGSFLVATIFQLKSCNDKKNEVFISNYEAELKTVTESNKLLQEQIKTYDYNLNAIRDSLKKQSIKLKELKGK